MELKSKLTLATLICAGFVATGCSQQQSAGSQQTTKASQQRTAECAPCAPTPAPVRNYTPPPRNYSRPQRPYRPPVVPPVKVPAVKAKGYYKGYVNVDPQSQDMLQGYQR